VQHTQKFTLWRLAMPLILAVLLALIVSAVTFAGDRAASPQEAENVAVPSVVQQHNIPYWQKFSAATFPAGWVTNGFTVTEGVAVPANPAGGTFSAIYSDVVYSGAYVYKVDMVNKWSADGNTARIIFNYVDDDTFYNLSIGGAGEVKLMRGWWTELATTRRYTPGGRATYAIYFNNGVITVKATRDGKTVTLFDRVVDHTIPAGKIGFGTAWTLAEFDNVEVTLGAYRDPYVWPFAQTSIWNTPIGSGAIFTPANIVPPTAYGLTLDEDVIIMEPDAPLMDVYFNFMGWGPGSREEGARCVAQGGLVGRYPIPDRFIRDHYQNSTPNSCAAILWLDSRTIKQNQPFHRCTGFPYATTGGLASDGDLYGDGLAGAHGGSGLSSMGGTLRVGELVPGGAISHALKINLFGHENFYYSPDEPDGKPGYRWPAFNADSYAGSGDIRYAGTNPELQMGSLLALPPDIDLTDLANNDLGLETEPGLILARAFQNYGGYIVDDTAWSVYAIATEWGPDDRTDLEFERVWGYPMVTPDITSSPWARDVHRIFSNLHVVVNNGPDSVGGGGTPRVPLAPPLRPWKIMPLGDSLTAGDADPNGAQSYRGDLYHLLAQAGYLIDFVGRQSWQTYAGGDPDHEGHGGFTIGPDSSTIGNIDRYLETYLDASEPDMILLLIGINDMFPGPERPDVVPEQAADKLEALVNRITQLRPNVRVMVSSLVPVNWDDTGWTAYHNVNARAAQIGNASPTDNIYFVDMYGSLAGQMTAADYMPDNLHLSASGARKVAQVWFDALTRPEVGLDREPPTPPYPKTEAKVEAFLPYGEKKLHGVPFGSGAASAPGFEFDKAYDGDPNTYFDAAAADGAFAGIDLGEGNAAQVTKIRFHPRLGNADRMAGGRFQGSNVATDTGYVDLYIIPATTIPGTTWNTVVLTNTQSFRYLRYLGPDGSHGNVAEVEFWTVGRTRVVTGTPFGVGPSWGNNPNTTYEKVFDGDTSTFYDYYAGSGGYAGIDLGPGNAVEVTAIRYWPRQNWEARMIGGRFQASNVATHTAYVDLFTVPQVPELAWNVGLPTAGQAQRYRYLRYYGPDGGYGNVSEVEFWTADDVEKLSGTPFGEEVTPPGYTIYLPLVLRNSGTSGAAQAGMSPHVVNAGYADLFDGDVRTAPDVGIAGIDLGAGHERAVAVIRYYTLAGRDLAGGRFQGAITTTNVLTGAGFVDLYTIPAGTTEATWYTVVLTDATPYRFLRYVAPAGQVGSVTEVEFWALKPVTPEPFIAAYKTADVVTGTLGTPVRYTCYVANPTTYTIDIEATDDRLGPVFSQAVELGPGESAVGDLVYWPGVLDPVGPLTNTLYVTGTVAGTGQTVHASASHVLTLVEGSHPLLVSKVASAPTVKPGDVVTYTYRITNVSGISLTVEAYDDLLGPVTLDKDVLETQKVAVGTLSTLIGAEDPAPLVNTVVVTGSNGSRRYVVEKSLSLDLTRLAVLKTADVSAALVGDDVVYTFQVTNTGSVPLVLTATDDHLGRVPFVQPLLLGGESTVGVITHELSLADYQEAAAHGGWLTNTVVVTGSRWVASYADNFDTPPSDWMIWATESGKLVFQWGELQSTKWPGRSLAVYTGTLYSGPYAYVVEAAGGGGDYGNAISLIFNYQDVNNFYQVRLDAGQGGAGTVQVRRGWWDILYTSPITYDIHRRGLVELAYVEGTVTVRSLRDGTTLLNAVPVLALDQAQGRTPLTYGYVGLGEMDNGEARFDDFTLYTAGEAVVARGRFALTVSAPPLVVEKTANVSRVAEGQTVTYTYRVVNMTYLTPTVYRLEGDDDKLGAVTFTPDTIGAGEVATATITYTVRFGDAPAVVNTVYVTGMLQLGTLWVPAAYAQDEFTLQVIPGGSVAVEKTADRTLAHAGEEIVYTYRVINTGLITLTVTAVDDPLGPVTLGDTLLSPGEATVGTLAYTVRFADQPVIANTVVVTGTPWEGPTVTAQDSLRIPVWPGGVRVEKFASASTARVGEVVTYTYAIHNDSNITLTLQAHDDLLGVVAFDDPVLAPGASTSASMTYVVTFDDLLAGAVTNTVVVTGTPDFAVYAQNFDAPPADWTISNPALFVVSDGALRTGPGTWDYLYALYDGATYAGSYRVSLDLNGGIGGADGNGAVVYFNHQGFPGGDIWNPVCYQLYLGGAGLVQLRRGLWETVATSDQRYDYHTTGRIELTYAAGRVTVVATQGTTTTVLFDNVPLPYPLTWGKVGVGTLWAGGASFDNLRIEPVVMTAQDTAVVRVVSADLLAVDKVANVPAAAVGEVVTYTYRVLNTAPITYTVDGRDDLLGPLMFDDATLGPGELATAVLTYVVQPGDLPLRNTVVVTGTPDFAVYAQNFDAPPADWTISNPALFVVSDGALRTGPGTWDYLYALYDGATYAGSYRVSLDLNGGIGGADGNGAVVYFNHQGFPGGDIWNPVCYQLYLGGAGLVQLRRGLWETVATSDQRYDYHTTGRIELTYAAGRVTVVATQGTTTTVLFDNVPLPYPLTWGKVGVGTLWAGGASFDNLRIEPVAVTSRASFTLQAK